MTRWFFVPLLLVACSASLDPAVRRPDGGWHLQCGSALERCVKHAEDLCKGKGYVVISGMSKRKLYGAELGVSQVEARDAELDVACADRRGDLPTVIFPSASSAPPPPSAPFVVAPNAESAAPLSSAAPSVVTPSPSSSAPPALH